MSGDDARTGFVWDELYMWHDTGTYAGVLPSGGGGPLQPYRNTENPDPKRRFKNLLDMSGMTRRLRAIEPRRATREEIERVHSPGYVSAIEAMSAEAGGDARMHMPFGHTPFGPGGYDVALLAAGGVLAAVDAVMTGEVHNAYALVRPIGHHAEPEHGLGFCVFNNGAIAARHAQAAHGIRRVAVVDWDVHHGNGAETMFWEDPDVLTISIHQENFFPPGRGDADARGAGPGEGFNVNVPLPPGSGAGAYAAVMDRVVVPALEAFRPELILVPCGFDAEAMDPLGRMMLHSDAFRSMTETMVGLADRLCGGRLVMCQEGGYHAVTMPLHGLAVVEALSGVSSGVEDPWMMIHGGMGGQELQPHQEGVVSEAAERVRVLND